MLCKTEWSWELRTWSHKMNLLDILSTSPHYFCGKWIGVRNENSNFDLRILGFKGLTIFRPNSSSRLIYLTYFGPASKFIHVHSNFELAIQLLTVNVAQCIFVHLTQFGKIWSCSSLFFCYQVVRDMTSWVLQEKTLWSKNMLLFCTNTEG